MASIALINAKPGSHERRLELADIWGANLSPLFSTNVLDSAEFTVPVNGLHQLRITRPYPNFLFFGLGGTPSFTPVVRQEGVVKLRVAGRDFTRPVVREKRDKREKSLSGGHGPSFALGDGSCSSLSSWREIGENAARVAIPEVFVPANSSTRNERRSQHHEIEGPKCYRVTSARFGLSF